MWAKTLKIESLGTVILKGKTEPVEIASIEKMVTRSGIKWNRIDEQIRFE
jgi:hypothetical protein